MWQWLKTNESQLKIVFALAGGLYALCEYRANVHATQVERALEYVRDYDRDEPQKASAKLYDFWRSRDARFRDRADKTPEGYATLLFELVDEADVHNDVATLEGFFRGVATCANAGVCDPETICSFFFDDAQGFRESYRPFLATWRATGASGVTNQLDILLDDTCDDELEVYCDQVPQSEDCS